MISGMKRPLQASTPPAVAKAPRNDDDQWSCAKCGNSNYASRLFCNKRTCGAPKSEEPWICPGCGNENYATRLFCNMKRCQMARPGLTAVALQQGMAAGMGPPGGGRRSSLGGAAPPPLTMATRPMMGADPRAMQEGSWTCECGNVNYPGRMVCNRRTCGKPRPAGAGGLQFGGMMMGAPTVYGGLLNAPRGGIGAPFQLPQQPMQLQQPRESLPPPGSWVCLACENVNYPTRTTCNKRTCGQPREAVDGGPPPESAFAPTLRAGEKPPPPGSWACPTCGNVNWPERAVCNRRTCMAPKPAM